MATLRNILVPIVMKIVMKNRRCKARAFHFISQLSIRYHQNPFLLDAISKNTQSINKQLSPGHRAPNALYKRNHDVFELIKGYQFHLLALSKKSLSIEEITNISENLALLPKDIGLPLKIYFIGHSLTGENERLIQAESNQIFDNYGLADANPFGIFLIRPDGYIAYRSNEMNVKNLIAFCDLFRNNK
jgi:hypothetical protein